MIYNHHRGAAVYTGAKLYAFCGTPEDKMMSATTDAEVYNFEQGNWEDLPKAPAGYEVDYLHALALSDTKILLVGGRWPGVKYTKASYIFDTEAKTYTHAGDRDTGESNGFTHMGCAVIPGGLKVICAGGWNDWQGETAR